jgi:hypothetical protein
MEGGTQGGDVEGGLNWNVLPVAASQETLGNAAKRRPTPPG